MTTLENPIGTIHHNNYILLINELCIPASAPDVSTYLSNLCNLLINDISVTWSTTWIASTQPDISFTYTGVAGQDSDYDLVAFASSSGASICNVAAGIGTYKLYLKFPPATSYEIDNLSGNSFSFDENTLKLTASSDQEFLDVNGNSYNGSINF